MAGLSLAAHWPLDLERLGALLTDQAELELVAPGATFPFDPEQWRVWLSDQGTNPFFIMSGGATAGHFALRRSDSECPHMSWLIVTPQYHGGTGRAVFALVFAQLRAQGKTGLTLNVLRTNARAVHLYERLGFTPLNNTAPESAKLSLIKRL